MPTRSIMPNSIALWLAAWGRELETSGHLLWAEWIFRQVTRRGPPSSTAYYLLGRIQTRRGKLTEGKESFAKGLVIKPDFYHCRVGFFGACREEYWQGSRSPRWRLGRKAQPAADLSALSLGELHRLVSRSLPILVWYEIARFDNEEDMDLSVIDSLTAMQRRMKGRSARALRRQLEEAREVLDRVVEAIRGLEAADAGDGAPLDAVVTQRDQTQRLFRGFRDGDDLVGRHLEIIHDGKMEFLPFQAVREVRFGRYGEFTDVDIRTREGRTFKAVIPTLYYGSRFSSMLDLRQGNVSMFKELYRGIQVGVGRRVFRGTHPETGGTEAVGIHEIEAIEFVD